MLRTDRQSSLWLGPLVLLLLLAAGCDEDGKFRLEAGVDNGDQDAARSIGPVAGFGSVYVNGERFNTSNTLFLINGQQSRSEGSLSEGMVVAVDVNAGDSGWADRITYDDDVQGPLTGDFDPRDRVMEVLGQRVWFNAATVFRGFSLDELDQILEQGPAYVRVSGWYLESGGFLASYVSSRQGFTPGVDPVTVRGRIEDFNLPNQTFRIGQLEIDYGSQPAVAMEGGRTQLLASDQDRLVTVTGQLRETDGVLVARRISQQDQDSLTEDIDGLAVELEGVIAGALDTGRDGSFRLGGFEVRLSDRTELDGLDGPHLQAGVRVRVEGVGERQSRLRAERVVNREPDVLVETEVGQVAASSRPREGELTLDGIRVRLGPDTIAVGPDAVNIAGRLDLADLRSGDFVSVAGVHRTDREGPFIEAVKLERRPGRASSLLVGAVDAIVSDRVLEVMGERINLRNETEFGPGVSAENMAVGDRLRIDYQVDSNARLLATRIERPTTEGLP